MFRFILDIGVTVLKLLEEQEDTCENESNQARLFAQVY